MPENSITIPNHRRAMVRILLTRGTSCNWRCLELAEQPILHTSTRRAELSACLTVHEAVRVALRRFPHAELYAWDEPNYIPGHNPTAEGRNAVRIVGTECRGVFAFDRKERDAAACARIARCLVMGKWLG